MMRSLLFVPANSWRLLLSSVKSEADAVVLDLEDSVPIGEKETARWFVKEFLREVRDSYRGKVFVRVNGIETGLTEEDLKYVVNRGLDGLVLPKATAEGVVKLTSMVKPLESSELRLPVIPLLETARGVLEAKEVVSLPRVRALAFGMGDYLRELGLDVNVSDQEWEVLFARSMVSTSAAMGNVPAIDTPFLGLIIDREGVRRQALIARRLGFSGKFAIHPSHVPVINEVFTPSETEVREAEEIVRAYEEAVRRGLGATSLRGMMIDRMNYERAKRLLREVSELDGG